MTYENIQEKFHEEFTARDQDKFHYRYPQGEMSSTVPASYHWRAKALSGCRIRIFILRPWLTGIYDNANFQNVPHTMH